MCPLRLKKCFQELVRPTCSETYQDEPPMVQWTSNEGVGYSGHTISFQRKRSLWSMVYGPWYMVHDRKGLWSIVYGLLFMVYGPWYMVYGSWFMVYGLSECFLDLRAPLAFNKPFCAPTVIKVHFPPEGTPWHRSVFGSRRKFAEANVGTGRDLRQGASADHATGQKWRQPHR